MSWDDEAPRWKGDLKLSLTVDIKTCRSLHLLSLFSKTRSRSTDLCHGMMKLQGELEI